MAKYSLINVTAHNGKTVSGYWLQDYHGTIGEARRRARLTERANGNKISVAVVDSVNSTTPFFVTDLEERG